MSSVQGEPSHSQATPQRRIGLSDTAEQRWRQLTGGRHLISAVPGLLEGDVQNNVFNQLQPVPTLAQAMGFASRPRPMYEEYEGETASDSRAHVLQEAIANNSTQDELFHTRGGTAVSAVRPTRQLLDEMFRNPDAPRLPASLQSLAAAGSFVPPAGEEWHVISGWHVRISRAELDQVHARAEASESEEDDLDSLADTAYGSGSDQDREERESAQASERSSDERSEGRNAV
eukprot:TRINITY_DN516_c1_g1_i2.p1 TRINITY_DN516_c1_g1~~TRINITY_DN516_c1_g1_i2.p1  ORF type:complete len:231 (-),score=30.36 TRINITY_DN516_c1_g1_i2:357-1049(-)